MMYYTGISKIPIKLQYQTHIDIIKQLIYELN